MSQYGNVEYWDERYTKYFCCKNRDPEPFEWYQRWAGIKETITEFLETNQKILNVGCGNSSKI